MARFGFDQKGSTHLDPGVAYIYGAWFTCPEAGTADSITVYITTAGQAQFKCAIYRKFDGALMGYTEELILPLGFDGWQTFKIISGGLLEPSDYWLVLWCSAKDWWLLFEIEANKGCRHEKYYDSFPEILSPVVSSQKLSIYCDYTPVVRPVLNVESSPISGVPFTLEGLSLITPFSSSMDKDTYTISMPETVTLNGVEYRFVSWLDGVTTPTRTINFTADMSLTANYKPVTPPPEHMVTIGSSPITGVPITVDGTSVGATPASVTVIEGDHTVSVPENVEV